MKRFSLAILLLPGLLWGDYDSADAVFKSGLAKEQDKDYSAAVADFKAALGEYPAFIKANRELGYCYYYLGYPSKAGENFDTYLQAVPSDEATRDFATRLRQHKVASLAPSIPRQALGDAPPNPRAFDHCGYVHVGLGARLIPGASVNRQFDLGASGGLSPTVPDSWDPDLDIAVGYQSPILLGLELGMGGGAGSTAADYTAVLRAGSSSSAAHSYTENFSYGSFYAMPSIRLPMSGLFQRPCFHTLGFQIGYATLYGDITTYDPYFSTSAVTKTHAFSTSYAACYRIEQMLNRRLSLGLELRYQWISFQPSFATGERLNNLDGSPLNLDLSGPSIKLSFAFWFPRPFPPSSDEAAEISHRAKLLRTRQRDRLRQRLEDLEEEYSQPDEPDDDPGLRPQSDELPPDPIRPPPARPRQ